MQCPSDAGFKKVFEQHNIAPTSYAGSQGLHWWPSGTAILGPWNGLGFDDKPAADFAGLFTPTDAYKLRDITDGTSNTLVIGETDTFGYYGGAWVSSGTGIRRPFIGWAVYRAAFIGPTVHGYGSESCKVWEVDGSRLKCDSDPNWNWFRAGPHVHEPTFIVWFGINTEWWGTSSYHGAGIQAAYADGSVRYVSSNINWKTYVVMNGIGDGYVAATTE